MRIEHNTYKTQENQNDIEAPVHMTALPTPNLARLSASSFADLESQKEYIFIDITKALTSFTTWEICQELSSFPFPNLKHCDITPYYHPSKPNFFAYKRPFRIERASAKLETWGKEASLDIICSDSNTNTCKAI